MTLWYKNGATRITTRVPVIEVSVESSDLFSLGAAFEMLLEAHDRRGQVVGEAKAGDRVNPATGIMTLQPGERVQVPLKMQLEFEGKFTVKALNPTHDGDLRQPRPPNGLYGVNDGYLRSETARGF